MTVQPNSVFRFAPSPTGYLHLGHAYSALRNHDLARACGGRLLLRIEDTDVARSRPEFVAAIYEDLRWLGLDWEQPVRRQSEHFGDYALSLERLQEQRLLFPCFCTRGDIAAATDAQPGWPRDPDGTPLYPGTCRHLSEGERARRLASGQHAALRLDMEQAVGRLDSLLGWSEYGEGDEPRDVRAEPMIWGDVVLGRKEFPASYHIAVVTDDAGQGVTDVVRGRDVFAATSLHRLLQHLLGLPAPRYRHHALIHGESGEKLAKTRGSPSLRDLRAQGLTPAQVREMAAAG